MLSMSIRQQFLVGLVLTLLMLLTRGHHFTSLEFLPSASWAVFFLAGVYFRSGWLFALLFLFAWIVDFAVYLSSSVGSFCITPAYAFLLPAYGSLWLAGRWYKHYYRFNFRTLVPLTIAVVFGGFICEVISSGSFYFFSGYFSQTSLVEFSERLWLYFPLSLQSLSFYVCLAVLVHACFMLNDKKSRISSLESK